MKNRIEFVTLKKENITDFAFERNELLKKAKTEWVFFVDSDETVSDKLKKEIEIATKFPDLNGYYISRKNYFLGQYVGTDKIIRLGRANSGKWKRKVHETWEIKGNTGVLVNTLRHDTARSLREYIKRMNYYSDLHAYANKTEGKQSGIIKIILYPSAKFVVTLIKSRNIVFSIMQSLHSFLSWSKLYYLHS